MGKYFFLSVSLAVVAGFSSCKDDKVEEPEVPQDPTLRITVQPMYGTETLYLDSTYTTPEGYDVQFTDIKFYYGSVFNGSETLIDAGLFDYRERGTLLLEASGKVENFSNLNGFVGIPSDNNHADPAAFPNTSMLNIAHSNDMHWGWNPGYIFMKVEAKVDTIQDGNALFDHLVVFHIGKDENLQSANFNSVSWGGADMLRTFALKLDMLNFLQNSGSEIDLKTEYTSHTAPGQEAISLKVITNFAASLSPL